MLDKTERGNFSPFRFYTNNSWAMKSKIKKYFGKSILGLAWAAVFPAVALAADNVQSGLSKIQGEFGTSRIFNANNVLDLIVSIIRILLMFSGAVAVLFVIIGGFQYITSGGNEEQAEKGKKTLINAIIGVIIIILSYTIINVIVNTVQNCTGGLFGC